MKKILLVTLTLSLIFLVACGNAGIIANYGDAEAFENALNSGENLEGKVVTFIVDNLETQSVYGYNIWAGEHLNFVSENNPNVNTGEKFNVKVKEVNSVLGSWIIKYETLSDVTTDDSTIFSK